MKIAFIGCVNSSFRALQKLLEMKSLGIEVVAVVTKTKSKVNADFMDLSPLCIEHNIPFHFEDYEDKPESIRFLQRYTPDVLYCFGWSHLLSKEMLNVAPIGTIGFHPAPLPKARGRHPIIWALALGLDNTASTFFKMDEGADSGPILCQVNVAIAPHDNASSLYKKILDVSVNQIFEFTLQLASGDFELKEQDFSDATYWRKRSRLDGEIDWRMRAEDIHNLVRALAHPYPGAEFIYKDKSIVLSKTSVPAVDYSLLDEPGKVLNVEKDRALIKCGHKSAIWIYDLSIITSLIRGNYL
jgi:methionyl-tRNA formyltransferase